MNNLVFNNAARKLSAALFGMYESEFIPVAVDDEGKFLFSPESAITVTASNFDIRDLNYVVDSVTVTATDLDIRSLTGTQDSVAVSSVGFTESTLTGTVAAGTSYIMATEIANYSQNSFFIRNLGGSTFTMTVQVAPTNAAAYYLDQSSAYTVSASANAIAAVTVAVRYARIKIDAGGSATYAAYYNGRA